MQIKLSTGETVHLSDVYTHKVEKAYNRVLLKDGVDGIAVNMLDAFDAALSQLITKIEGKGGEVPYSPEWIDGLSKQDFGKLKEAVDNLAEDEAPKKILEQAEAHLTRTVGESMVPIEYLDYLLCKELGCTPEDLDRMDEATYRLYQGFLRLEAKSGTLRSQQQAFYA